MEERGEKYSFLVVGGGIVGTSLAYVLSCFGKQVLLVESEFVASGCTGLSAGTIACAGPGNGKDPDLTASYNTREMLRAVTEEGYDAGYEETGALQLALNDDEKHYMMDTKFKWLQSNGYKAQWLGDNAQVRRIEPGLSDAVKAAVLLPLSGHVDPQMAAQAFADAAASRGAKILEQTEVTSLSDNATNSSGVVVTLADKKDKKKRRDVLAEQVILATGGGVPNLYPGKCGALVKIVPVKGTIWLTPEPLPPSALRHVIYVAESSKFWEENPQIKPPVTHDPQSGRRLVMHAYGKRMRDGRIMFGGDRIPLTSESKVQGSEADRVQTHVEYIARFLPAVAVNPAGKGRPMKVTDSWSGVMPFSGQGYRHICTKLSDRVTYFGGFGSHGIMYGPGYAKQFVREMFLHSK